VPFRGILGRDKLSAVGHGWLEARASIAPEGEARPHALPVMVPEKAKIKLLGRSSEE